HHDDGSAATPTATASKLSIASPRSGARTPLGAVVTPAEPGVDEDEQPLDIIANADTDSGDAPLTVKFTARVTGGPKGLQYRWEFGDHTPAVHQLNAVHKYEDAGGYIATFWVNGP